MDIFNKNIFSGLCILAVLSGCGEKAEDKSNDRRNAQKVSILEVNLSEQDEILTYSGSIEADNTVSIGFSVAGRVTTVYVQEGQHVSKGQLLASIEQNAYLNTLAVATAGFEQAQDNFNRLDQLYKKNSLPERDYIAAKIALTQTIANRASAKKNLEDTKLYASFSGIVTKKLTEAGATAAPGVPAFTIVKTDRVYAAASVTENEISSLNIGAEAEISIPSLNRKLDGKITIINPQADNASRTYTVKVRLDNSGGKLLPGMIADINIKTGKNKNSIHIPALAIVRGPDNINYVFLAKPDSTAIKKRVNIAKITGASEVIVDDGLHQGDKLIVTGQTNLEDGSLLKF